MRHVALLILPALALAACERGEAGGDAEREFPATGFDRVVLAGPDEMVVTSAPAFSVRAQADEEVLERLEVSVVDGELRIARRDAPSGWGAWLGGGHSRAVVNVGLPTMRGMTVSGAGNATVTGAAAPVFVGAVEGAGNLTVERLEARTAVFKLSGAGNLELSGRAANTTLQVTGAGNVSAGALETRDIDVSLSGVGNVEARATGRARVRLNGVGNVSIAGTDDCQVSTTGAGAVKCEK